MPTKRCRKIFFAERVKRLPRFLQHAIAIGTVLLMKEE